MAVAQSGACNVNLITWSLPPTHHGPRPAAAVRARLLEMFELAQQTIPLEELEQRNCAKWTYFPEGVLPLWVAEMDLPVAAPIREAIKAHVDTHDFGYPMKAGAPGMCEALCARLATRYDLRIDAPGVLSLASTVAGINLAARAFAEVGDEVLLLTPLYPPFRKSLELTGRVPVEVELVDDGSGYAIDFDALQAAVGPRTRMLMLCNPHNPIGRVFTREELDGLAEFALRNDLMVVSDELHADLTLDGRHLSIAALGDEIAERTITLYGPTKAFNIPGLNISFALATKPELLERLQAAAQGLAGGPNRLAQVATLAAYTEGDDWLESTLALLRSNREQLLAFVKDHLPAVKVHRPQGTYLAWLDLRDTGLGDEPAKVLAERAKVGLNEGADFGRGGSGFVRLNFATSPEILGQALERLRSVIG